MQKVEHKIIVQYSCLFIGERRIPIEQNRALPLPLMKSINESNTKSMAEFKKDSNKMVLKFFKICKGLRHFILTNSVNIEELKWILQHCISYETIKETDCHRSLTSDDIKNEQDIAKLMGYISSFSSFFNFKLVEEVIDVVGYEEGKQMIEQYKKDFENYLKGRVTQCPTGMGPKGDQYVRFSVQLDNTYKECRMAHLFTLQEDICEILQIKTHCLLVEGLEPGSIWVVFYVLKQLVQHIFPLTEYKIILLSQLRYLKAKILTINCLGYSIELWRSDDSKLFLYVFVAVVAVFKVITTFSSRKN